MKIILGLGNPGAKYAKTRHNVGFEILDNLQQTFRGNFSEFKDQSTWQAEVSEGRIETEPVLLIKSTGFYNNSGMTAQAVLQYFNLTAEDLIVIHDDLDLLIGGMRISKDASAAGNNGVKSIIDTLGTKNFTRVRIGIANMLRDKMEAQDFVLKAFSREDRGILKDLMPVVLQAMVDLVEYYPDIERVQNMYN